MTDKGRSPDSTANNGNNECTSTNHQAQIPSVIAQLNRLNQILIALLLLSLILLAKSSILGIVRQVDTWDNGSRNKSNIARIVMWSIFSIDYISLSIFVAYIVYSGHSSILMIILDHLRRRSNPNQEQQQQQKGQEHQSSRITNKNAPYPGTFYGSHHPKVYLSNIISSASSSNNDADLAILQSASWTSSVAVLDYPDCLLVVSRAFLCIVVGFSLCYSLRKVQKSATTSNIVACVGYGFFTLVLMRYTIEALWLYTKLCYTYCYRHKKGHYHPDQKSDLKLDHRQY